MRPTQIDGIDLYWDCMFCKDTRPDEFITVTKIEIGGEDDPRERPFVFNYRHCTDRVPCRTAPLRAIAGDLLISEEP